MFWQLQGQNKTKTLYSSARWAWHLLQWVFLGTFVVFHLLTNACYLKVSWWLFTLWAWKTLPFFSFSFFLNPYTLWNTWKNVGAKIIVHLWSIWAKGWRVHLQGISETPVLVSVAVVPWALLLFQRERADFSFDSQKMISIKMYFKVFTVNILILFCFWHQTKSF